MMSLVKAPLALLMSGPGPGGECDVWAIPTVPCTLLGPATVGYPVREYVNIISSISCPDEYSYEYRYGT